ncbi:MAG: hypothetical protein ABJJ37_05795 [Roseibium sp.]
MLDPIRTLAPFALTFIAALCILVMLLNERARQLADQRAQKSFGQWPEAEDLNSPHSTNARVHLLPDVAARRVATGLAVFIPVGETFFFSVPGGLS